MRTERKMINEIIDTETLKIAKPVLQIKNGLVIKRWDSAKSAEKEKGFNPPSIRDVCIGRRKTHKGFEWRYDDDSDISSQNIGIKKSIECIYDNGEIEVFPSKKEASEKLLLKESTIQNIVRNKTKQKPNFKLQYGTN